MVWIGGVGGWVPPDPAPPLRVWSQHAGSLCKVEGLPTNISETLLSRNICNISNKRRNRSTAFRQRIVNCDQRVIFEIM